MTTFQELFLAILSMDAYNRGYGAGIGGAASGLGETGQIGSATLLTREDIGISDAAYQAWQEAGFYAIAYNWNGRTVISYRGTDFDGITVTVH